MSAVLADIGIGPISIPTPGDVVTALRNAVVDVANAVFDKIIEWIAGLLAQAVSKVTEALVTLLSAIKTTLTPGGAIAAASSIQASIAGMAAMLVTIFFVFRLIHGLITGQAGQNLRATIVDLPIVVVGTLFFGFLCYTLLQIIDAFSGPLITGYATTLNDTVTKLYSQDGIVQGGVFVIIFALLYIIAAVFLCFELFVRSSLIYLVVMFAPLAIATRVWGPTRSYARRATETAVALIFSKLAIAVTLATGASLMAGAADTGGNVAMIQGSAILLLAAFMPFGLMRVIPMMEGAIAGEGVARTMGAKAAGGAIVAGTGLQLAHKGFAKTFGKSKGQSSAAGGSSGGGNTGDPTGGAGGGSTPPAKPAGPGGGGSTTNPILRPSAATPPGAAGATASAGATPTPSTSATTPSSSGTTSVLSNPMAPNDQASAGSSDRPTGGTVPTAGGDNPRTASTTSAVDATAPPAAGTPTSGSPASGTPASSAPASGASVSLRRSASTTPPSNRDKSTPTDGGTAAATEVAPVPSVPKIVGTPPLKTRGTRPSMGLTPGGATTTASRTTRTSRPEPPPSPAGPTSNATPPIPKAKSRTIERPVPRTKPSATSTIEKEQS